MARKDPTKPCGNMLDGRKCRRGRSCSWSHDPKILKTASAYKKFPCMHWTEHGSCKFGKKCFYSHEIYISDEALQEGLDQRVHAFVVVDDNESPLDDTTSTDCKEMGSYSRSLTDESKIFVPGVPPALVHPSLPMQLLPDLVAFEDQSRPDFVPYPFRFEPAFAAMIESKQNMQSLRTSIITSLNCLRKLFRFVQGKTTNKFRIDIQNIGTSIFLTRWEQNSSTLAYPWNIGYGKGFEQACTLTKGNLDVASFHRLVSYKLGSVQLLVQHEVDACRCDCAKESWNNDLRNEGPDPSLGAPMSPSHGGGTSDANGFGGSSTLKVERSGLRHDAKCLVEIKTGAHDNSDTDHDTLAQLWLSRSHNLLLGRHQHGKFSGRDLKEEDMTEELRRWQLANVEPISRLAKFLHQLRGMVLDAPSSSTTAARYALVYTPSTDKDRLLLYPRQNGQDMLPTHLWSHLEAEGDYEVST